MGAANELETRVDRIEDALIRFVGEVTLLNRAAEARMIRLEHEMREFKNEMLEFKQEMRTEMREFKNEMLEFKNEMRTEMLEFKNEMRLSKRDLDKKWGDLANRLGTIVEDILTPNLKRAATEHFHIAELEDVFVRREIRRAGKVVAEYDVVIASSELVVLGEARSNPSPQSVRELADKLERLPLLLPEYRDRKRVMVLGSWAFSDEVIRELKRQRIYGMCFADDSMCLVNARELGD